MANSGNFFGSINPNEWIENLRISNPEMFNNIAATLPNSSNANATQNSSASNATQSMFPFNTTQNYPHTFQSEAYHSPDASPQNSFGNLGYYSMYGSSPRMQNTPENVPETQVDEMEDEEEVVVVEKPRKGKKPSSTKSTTSTSVDKWTPAENAALVAAHIQVTTCSKVGTNRRKIGVWKSVSEVIRETARERPNEIRERSEASCKGRHGRIQELVNKFTGHYSAAKTMLGNASGYQPTDVLARAHELYELDMGSTFDLEYCWSMMEEQPKWKQMQPQPRANKKSSAGRGRITGRESSSQPSSGSEKRSRTDEDGHYTENISVPIEQNISEERPIGRDAAKAGVKAKGKKVAYSSSSSSHAETMQNYSTSLDKFGEAQVAAMQFEREKATWQKQERRENLLSALLQKEIAGKELTQKEQEVKEKLLNDLHIA